MQLLYRPIQWWPDAYHVYNGSFDKRIGIVNKRIVRATINHVFTERDVWFAHNINFFSIKGEYVTRTLAAEAIPRGAVHQRVEAFS